MVSLFRGYEFATHDRHAIISDKPKSNFFANHFHDTNRDDATLWRLNEDVFVFLTRQD